MERAIDTAVILLTAENEINNREVSEQGGDTNDAYDSMVMAHTLLNLVLMHNGETINGDYEDIAAQREKLAQLKKQLGQASRIAQHLANKGTNRNLGEKVWEVLACKAETLRNGAVTEQVQCLLDNGYTKEDIEQIAAGTFQE